MRHSSDNDGSARRVLCPRRRLPTGCQGDGTGSPGAGGRCPTFRDRPRDPRAASIPLLAAPMAPRSLGRPLVAPPRRPDGLTPADGGAFPLPTVPLPSVARGADADLLSA